jgi:hypothetical protein
MTAAKPTVGFIGLGGQCRTHQRIKGDAPMQVRP